MRHQNNHLSYLEEQLTSFENVKMMHFSPLPLLLETYIR